MTTCKAAALEAYIEIGIGSIYFNLNIQKIGCLFFVLFFFNYYEFSREGESDKKIY